MNRALLAILYLSVSSSLSGVTLTNAEIFKRCFAQLTQTQVETTNPLYQAVVAGSKTPLAACLEVLDSAQFGTNNRISDPNNATAKGVLRTLQKLHASFFTERDILIPSGIYNLTTQDIYDSETAAFYYTRALFRPNTEFRSVVTLDSHLRAIRTNQDPANGAATGTGKATTIFGNAITFASTGELLGIEATGPLTTHYEYNTVDAQGVTVIRSGDINFGMHLGGGVLGSVPYLLAPLSNAGGVKANGRENMPRRWAKNVYADLLARELPVIYYADTAPFKNNSSTISFRKTQGCLQCHATMDRAAAVVRGINLTSFGPNLTTNRGPSFITVFPPVGVDSVSWPAVAPANQPNYYANYYKREPDGVLYFRNYDGALVDVPVRGPAEFGAALANQKDLYLATVKRYYAYFMGVDVPIDPLTPGTLTATDQIHKRNIEDITTFFQSSQRLRDVIVKILSLPEYRSSSFGAH